MKNEVFLSFRGEDTRDNFTSHLYDALRRLNIVTFIDDQLIRGDQISSSLLRTIQESRISVIVFSDGYASSRWCLQELAEILRCKESCGQIVLPVFCRVDPSDVRNPFGEGFAKVEERYKDMVATLQTWRAALRKAADLSGFNSAVIRRDSELVQVIVENILERLNDESPTIIKKLVGIHSKYQGYRKVTVY